MKKITFLFTLLCTMCIGALAQTSLLSSEDLNAKTTETRILLRNVSGTNGYWFNGVSSDENWGAQNVFVWVPAADGTFYLKKAYPTAEQGEGYVQTAVGGGAASYGAAATAEPFVTVHPVLGGSGQLAISEAGEDWPAHAVMDNLVRFVSQTTNQYLNVQGMTGIGGFRGGTGGWSFNNVYDASNYYRLTVNIVKDGETTVNVTMQEVGTELSAPVYEGYTCDYTSMTMPAEDTEVTITYTEETETEAVGEFDFTAPETLEPSVTPSPDASSGVEFNEVTFTNGGISFNVAQGEAGTAVRIWTKSGPAYELRTYKSSVITVTAPEGLEISSIAFVGGRITAMTANCGSLSDGAWSGSANSVVFSVTGTLNIENVTVTASAPMPAVSAPAFSVEGGVYTGAVTVNLSSEAYNIEEDVKPSIKYYYTLDGSEPTAESTRAWGVVSISSSCTLKAIAVMTIGEDVYISDVASADYIISEIKPFKMATSADDLKAGKILIVADTLATESLTGNYGYLYTRDVNVNGAYIEDIVYYAYELEAAEGGWYLKDANGKYLYMNGTYNSFNVSADVPESAGVWTIAVDEEGVATITNVEKAKYIQYSTNYNSFGSYADAQESAIMPKIYVVGDYPTLTWTPSADEKHASLQEFTFVCVSGLAVNEEAGVPTLYNPMAYEVDSVTGEYVFLHSWDLDVKVVDDTTVVLSVPEEVVDEGTYHFNVPAGYFILDPSGLAIASEEVYGMYDVIEMSPLTLVSVTPAQGEVASLSVIELVFSHDLGEVNKTFSVLDAAGQEVTTASLSYKDADGNWYKEFNKVAVKLAQEITAAGTYTIEIPAGLFYKSSDMSMTFEGVTLSWTVKESAPVIDIAKSYRIKDVATGLYLHVAEYNANNVGGPVGSVIVNEMKDVNDQIFRIEEVGDGSYYIVSENGHYIVCRAWNVDACDDGQKTPITFDYVGDGQYNFVNANGYFKVENINGTYYPFCDAKDVTIAANWVLEEAEPIEQKFEIVGVYPSVDEPVDSLTSIYVTFNENVYAPFIPNDSEMAIWNEDHTKWYSAIVHIEGNMLRLDFASPIYEAGRYLLLLPPSTIYGEDSNIPLDRTELVFEVTGNFTNIDAVGAEDGEQVIYDLTGRRVEKAVNGVYIINGNKVLVK